GSCLAGYKGNNGGGNCPDLNGLPPTGTVTLSFTTSFTIAPTILSVTSSDPSDDLSDIIFGPGVLSSNGLSAEYCYYVGPNHNHNLWAGNIVLTFNLQFAVGQGCSQQGGQPAPGSLTPSASDGPIVSNGCLRSQTRTFTATDACGNSATTSRTATWTVDVTAPVITATGTPANGALGCNPTSAAIEAALGAATATDACGTPTVTSSTGSIISNGCLRSQTRTFVATDACGNTSATSRTATWTVDVTAPVITATGTPANGQLGCNPTSAAIEAALGAATATDACGTPTVTSSTGTIISNGCLRSQTR